MTVLIYVNTSKQIGDVDHLKVFANEDAAETWLQENDPEGVVFEYPGSHRSWLAGFEAARARRLNTINAINCLSLVDDLEQGKLALRVGNIVAASQDSQRNAASIHLPAATPLSRCGPLPWTGCPSCLRGPPTQWTWRYAVSGYKTFYRAHSLLMSPRGCAWMATGLGEIRTCAIWESWRLAPR